MSQIFLKPSSNFISLIIIIVLNSSICKIIATSTVIAYEESTISMYVFARGNGTISTSSMSEKYSGNVRELLFNITSVSSDSSSSPPPFYNTSIGQNPDTVYGSYLCRGDLSPQHCSICVTNMTQFLELQFVKTNDSFQDWYGLTDECTIHFANHSIYGLYVKDDVFLPGPADIPGEYSPNMKEINDSLTNRMDMLISLASNSSTKFVTSEVDVIGSSDHEKLYVLVQCTPDLCTRNCSDCLKEMYSNFLSCCGGYSEARVIDASCMMKYDNQSFFDTSNAYHGLMQGYSYVYFLVVLSTYLISM